VQLNPAESVFVVAKLLLLVLHAVSCVGWLSATTPYGSALKDGHGGVIGNKEMRRRALYLPQLVSAVCHRLRVAVALTVSFSEYD